MKKIFTLISMALVAMSVNAQTAEEWKASDLTFEGGILQGMVIVDNTSDGLKKVPTQYPTKGYEPTEAEVKADGTASLTLKDYTFKASTTNVTLVGVSTPNSDGTSADSWRTTGGAGNNQALDITQGDYPLWTNYVNAKTGNPSMEAIEYFYTNSTGGTVGPRYVETYWTPGCGKLPAKGEYLEITFAKKGTLIVGLFINRPTSNLYILDKETIQLIAPDKIKIEGYVNNNTVTYGGLTEPFQTLKVNDDYTISHSNPEISIPGKQILAYVTIDVDAKTYLLFNPKNQLGIYGFKFTPDGSTGINNVKKAAEADANAPIFNLAGQKADKSQKGILIQNGKKFVNK